METRKGWDREEEGSRGEREMMVRRGLGGRGDLFGGAEGGGAERCACGER